MKNQEQDNIQICIMQVGIKSKKLSNKESLLSQRWIAT
jgi:hypothetical protein